jgi:hypothetical protein
LKRGLIVGCRYTGMHLAARLLDMDFRVVGTTRREARAAELEAAGIEPLAGELGEVETLRRKLANKRVRSLRLKDDLMFELRYPTYREGLAATLEQERRN